MCLTWLFMSYKEQQTKKEIAAKYIARGLPPPGTSGQGTGSSGRMYTDSGYHSGQHASQHASFHTRTNPNGSMIQQVPSHTPPAGWQPPQVPAQFLDSPPKPTPQMRKPSSASSLGHSSLSKPVSNHPYAATAMPDPPSPVVFRQGSFGGGRQRESWGGDPIYGNMPMNHPGPGMVAR